MNARQAIESGVVSRHRDHTGTFYQADGQGERRFTSPLEALTAHDEWRRNKDRHAQLVSFHHARGWLNCEHKSLERLEAEYAAQIGGCR